MDTYKKNNYNNNPLKIHNVLTKIIWLYRNNVNVKPHSKNMVVSTMLLNKDLRHNSKIGCYKNNIKVRLFQLFR